MERTDLFMESRNVALFQDMDTTFVDFPRFVVACRWVSLLLSFYRGLVNFKEYAKGIGTFLN